MFHKYLNLFPIAIWNKWVKAIDQNTLLTIQVQNCGYA
jgi:hypothetical protein